MRITIEVPMYDGEGVDVIWEKGSKLAISVTEGVVIINANQAGLLSLAKQMLYLASNDLPDGSHVHYDIQDPYFVGISSSHELILEKTGRMCDNHQP